MKHLIEIQKELKAPKGRYNSFGKYSYRSCEDILEAVKPICAKNGCALFISDEMVLIGERYYVKATATLKTPSNEFSVTGYARESDEKKGMDSSQITGSSSSYARKYALNGLLCIDDNKDADTDEYHKQVNNPKEPKKPKEKSPIPKEELIDIVTEMCDKKRFRVADLCERSGVEKLEDMTSVQLSKWVDWLEAK